MLGVCASRSDDVAMEMKGAGRRRVRAIISKIHAPEVSLCGSRVGSSDPGADPPHDLRALDLATLAVFTLVTRSRLFDVGVNI